MVNCREYAGEGGRYKAPCSFLRSDTLLPSEKAFAYKMKLDAMKRQGQRTDLTSRPLGEKLLSVDQLSNETPDSARQIHRYIRLTELISEVLDLVDNSVLKEKDKLQIALRPAVELSYLTQQEQHDLYETMITEDCTPSHVQASYTSQTGYKYACEPTTHAISNYNNPVPYDADVPFSKTKWSKSQSKHLSGKKIWLIAAVIVLAMLLVGCAVAYAMIIFGNPAEMIFALYGEKTGFDSAPPTEVNDPGKPGSAYTVPGYEKQPVEETVAQELEKWVSPVGKSITADGYKLTVDAYIYDSTTQSGFITLLLRE